MKLHKLTRKQLATGQAVTFAWPDASVTPRRNRRYKLSTESGKAADREFIVLEVKEDAKGFTVTAKMFSDPVRLLGRRTGYTDRPSSAIGATDRQHRGNLWDEPEAVDEVSQARITRDARERDRESIGELLVALEDLRAAVKKRLEGNPEAVRIMGRDAWALRSKIDSVERRLKRRHAA